MNSHYEKFLATGVVKCIDSEIPFDIPSGWEWVRMQHVIEFINGRAYKKEELLDKGKYKVLRVGNFFTNDIWYYSDLELPEEKYCYNGDLLYAWSASFGPQIWIGDKTIFHYHIWNVKYNSIVLSRAYLYHYLLFDTTQIRKSTTGSTMIHVSMENMNPRLIPIPPMSEQHRIAQRIEELLPLIERYEQTQKDIDKLNNGIKNKLRESILQEAIQGKLVPQDPTEGTAEELLQQIKAEKVKLVKEGKSKKQALADSTIFKGADNRYWEKLSNGTVKCIDDEIPFDIPDNWMWVRLNDVCFITTGASFKKEDANRNQKGVRVLRGGNVTPFKLILKTDDLYVPFEQIKGYVPLLRNDLVTPAVTSLDIIGKTARVEVDMPNMTVGGFVFILRAHYNNDWLSKYLLFVMSAPTTIEFIKSITNKSGQAFYNIGKERLLNAPIPIPPFNELVNIVEKVNDIFVQL